MNLSGENKMLIGVVIVTLMIVGVAIFAFSGSPEGQEAPVIPEEQLIPDNAQSTSPSEIKATLVEFSDFQCPACASYHPLVKQIVDAYGENLRFVYRHYPLEQHNQARDAAIAAEAAGAQGKFWEMHDLLFENQDRFEEEPWEELAQELELDLEEFRQSFDDSSLADKVNRDLTDGKIFGVNSTPTFFLNGQKLNLFTQADLVTAVEEALGVTPADK